MARRKNTRSVKIVSPGSSQIPRGLGRSRRTPTPPDPIAPVTIARHQQITEGPHVRVVNPKCGSITRQGG